MNGLEVDYTRTATRPLWEALPAEVRGGISRYAGSAVIDGSAPVGAGFTTGYAGLITLADGRRLFAKAAGPDSVHARPGIVREREVLPQLGGLRCASRLVGGGPVGEWEVLLLEAIEGTMPGRPWTPAAVDAAHEACTELAAFSPTDVAQLSTGSWWRDLDGDGPAQRSLDDLAAGGPWPAGLTPLAGSDAAELATLGRQVSGLVGDQLVHGDLRPDNLLLSPDDTIRVLDWNWTASGPGWLDWVGLWPLMVRQGVDPAGLTASPLLVGVDPDDVDAFLATIIGYMVDGGPPPGEPTDPLPAIHAHRRFFALTFLDLLRLRRGWS